MLSTALIALTFNTAQADSRINSLNWVSLGASSFNTEYGADAAVGIRGYTAKMNALEASANLFSTQDGVGGHLIRFSGYRYNQGGDAAAWYGGGGMGLGGHTDMGFGVQAHASVGYEFLRKKAIGSFAQADVTSPIASVNGGGFDNWAPILSFRVGIGLGNAMLSY